MWGSTVPDGDNSLCTTCPALADCANAVRLLRAVRCEDLPYQPPPSLHHTRNPLRSKFARALRPGQEFTLADLARFGTPGSARAWIWDATRAGLVVKTDMLPTGHHGGQIAVYTFTPEGILDHDNLL
jgi:hypothetical protein